MDLEETIALVRRAQEDDRAARDALFARYLPRVRTIVAWRSGKRLAEIAELEDLVQESLLQALRGLRTFQPRSDGTFYDWVGAIVSNRIRDEWRNAHAAKRDRGRIELMGAWDTSFASARAGADPSPSPSEHAMGAELGVQIEDAILDLEERDREAILLREVCGMSYAEIADRWELGSESSARAVVTRAKARLAERLP